MKKMKVALSLILVLYLAFYIAECRSTITYVDLTRKNLFSVELRWSVIT